MIVTKAHAFGNDFLLLASHAAPAGVAPGDLARRASAIGTARLGADGLIVVRETPDGAETDLYNADGSPSEVSGNGIRCVGAWLADDSRAATGWATRDSERVPARSALTLLGARRVARFTFRAGMGTPEDLREERSGRRGAAVTAVVMRVGNPQCVGSRCR